MNIHEIANKLATENASPSLDTIIFMGSVFAIGWVISTLWAMGSMHNEKFPFGPVILYAITLLAVIGIYLYEKPIGIAQEAIYIETVLQNKFTVTAYGPNSNSSCGPFGDPGKLFDITGTLGPVQKDIVLEQTVVTTPDSHTFTVNIEQAQEIAAAMKNDQNADIRAAAVNLAIAR